MICYDDKFTNCLMYRRPHEHTYRVLHRPWVADDCVLRENVYDPSAPSRDKGKTHRTVELAVLGAITKDRTGCTDQTGHVHPIGTQYYREHGHLWVCATPRIEEQRDRCFLALAELPHKMQNQVTQVGRVARALDHGLINKVHKIDKLPAQAVNTAEGVVEGRITAGTVAGAIEAKAKYIAEHASIDAAKGWIDRQLHDAREWAGKPAIEQTEDLAENTGDAMIPHPLTVGATVITGGLGRKMLGAVGELEEVAQAGTTLNKAEKKAAQAIRAAERKASSPGKMQQEVLRGQAPRDIHRVDRPHVTSGESQVHFCNGTSCNQSGTIHDAHKGAPNPSTGAREWLEKHGWTPPEKP